MATTIDTLVVELVLAVDKFKQGMAQAQAATRKAKEQTLLNLKDWEAMTTRADDALAGLARRALSVVGILAGGLSIEKLVSHWVPFTAEIGRTSRFLNIAEKDLLAWESAGEAVGAATGEIRQNIVGLADALGKFRFLGEGDIGPMFAQFGITVKDQQGNWKNAIQLLGELAIKFKNLDPLQKQTFISKFGLTTGMRDLLDLGEKLAPLLDEMKSKFTFSAEQIEAARELQVEWAKAQAVFKNFGIQIAALVKGPGEELLKWVQALPKNWEDTVFGEKGTLIREMWDKGWRTAIFGEQGEALVNWATTSGLHLNRGGTAQPGAAPSAATRNAPVFRRRPTGMGPGGTFTDQYGTWQLHPELGSDEIPTLPPPGAGDKRSSINTNINVASLVVYSAAQDAAGIAGDIRKSLEAGSIAANANTGQV